MKGLSEREILFLFGGAFLEVIFSTIIHVIFSFIKSPSFKNCWKRWGYGVIFFTFLVLSLIAFKSVAIFWITLLFCVLSLFYALFYNSKFIRPFRERVKAIKEVIASKEVRGMVVTISDIKDRSAKDKYERLALSFIKRYMEEEKSDLEAQMVVTTFSNYARLVEDLVETALKIAGESTKVILVTQNTVNPIRWFNFHYTRTDEKWVNYISFLKSIDDKGSVSIKRFMGVVIDYGNQFALLSRRKDDIPFDIIEIEGKKIGVNDVYELYKKIYNEQTCLIYPRRIKVEGKEVEVKFKFDKKFNVDIKYLLAKGNLKDMFNGNDIFEIKGEKIKYDKDLEFFPIINKEQTSKFNNYQNIGLIDALNIIYGNTKFYLYWINKIQDFYGDLNKGEGVPEDFFSIVFEKEIERKMETRAGTEMKKETIRDVAFIIGALADSHLETVKLYFLSSSHRIGKNPVSNKKIFDYKKVSQYVERLAEAENSTPTIYGTAMLLERSK